MLTHLRLYLIDHIIGEMAEPALQLHVIPNGLELLDLLGERVFAVHALAQRKTPVSTASRHSSMATSESVPQPVGQGLNT